MDDPQRQPKDSDREGLAARITQAGEQGRINVADRDIRLGNVRSATSMHELDLMRRELDQLDASLPPTAQEPATVVQDIPRAAIPVRALAVLVCVVVAIAVVVAGVVYLGGRTGGSDTSAEPAPRPEADVEPGGADPGGADPGGADPAGVDPGTPSAKYSLTAAGITGFLKTYRTRFRTSRVVDLTLYDTYAVVRVPVPGKGRQEGWLYRAGTWTSFGGVRAVFPGSQPVNLGRLDVAALVRNIRRAKRSLKVEKPKAYVVIRFIRPVDQAPRVDVHVSNEANESGYLTTTTAGRVLRSYAYDSGR